jgi:Ser/Thr protein kinase RdoA (MazF antagonist)
LGDGPEVSGLIHADLHQENYLFCGGQVAAIDFDDCGHGPFVYDLAVTLSELQHRGDYPALRAGLLTGYRSVRPLTAEQERLIDIFIALRFVQLMMAKIEERDQPMFRDTWVADVTTNLNWLQRFIANQAP